MMICRGVQVVAEDVEKAAGDDGDGFVTQPDVFLGAGTGGIVSAGQVSGLVILIDAPARAQGGAGLADALAQGVDAVAVGVAASGGAG
ncbi:hypothetical protein [Methylovulum sp.]|uniref:hypothetical protein n=1 Tax=Methylovulum sp. TaxID=1916980 RepID=UPI002614959D|nr:hypothetical protein [Methylovulum sp.]